MSPAEQQRSQSLLGSTVVTRVLLGFFVVYVCYFGVRAVFSQWDRPDGDWGTYYLAGAAARNSEPLYSLDRGPLLTFKYAPVVALGSMWTGCVPRTVARGLWYVGDLLGLLGIMALTLRLLYPAPDAVRPPPAVQWQLAGCAVLLLINYVGAQLHAGQSTSLFVLLTILSFCLATRQRLLLAGLVLSLAVAIKLVPLCFLPYLLLRPAWSRGLAGFLIGVLLLVLLPAFWFGWDHNLALHLEWLSHLRETNLPVQVYRIQNQSLYAQMIRFFYPTDGGSLIVELPWSWVRRLWLVLACLTAALLYGWHLLTERRLRPRGVAIDWQPVTLLSLLLIYMTVFNPLAWRYNFIALLPAVLLVLEACRRWPDRRATLTVLLTAAIVCQHPPMRDALLPGVLLHQFGIRLAGVGLLTFAVWLAWRRSCQRKPAQPVSS